MIPPEEHLYHYKATVDRVVDGDTIVVLIDLGFTTWRHTQWLRLARIDAPEVHTVTRDEGLAATAFLRELLPPGQQLIVETIRDKHDSFKRYLAELWLDGVNINDYMVAHGHAIYREY